jgi:hypothetical protein
MQRRLARLAVPALLLALLVVLAALPASAAEQSTPTHPIWLQGIDGISIPVPRPATCFVWIGTDYFTDPGLTNRVGFCTITCNQAYYGNVEPTFAGGGTCSGTSGPYTLRRSYGCPGICP